MFFLTLQTAFVWAQETVIKGLILDYYTKEPLPYADVLFKGTDIGVTADIDGRYEITTTDLTLDILTVSYTGYDSRNVKITPGISQRATIELKPEEYILDGVDIVAEKKIRKDTAAHTLFRNVIKHKPDNAPDNYNNYIYENYTKTIFGLYDVKDRFRSRIIIRKVPFIFDNIDTVESSQTTILPGLMKENYKHVLYRKDPKKTREILIGDKLSGTSNSSISDLIEFNYDDVNIYDNIINVNGKPIMSPFADNALINYKYFLTDTQVIDGYYCYQLQFTGRSSKDNAFSGMAWIHDTTYAIKEIQLSLLPQANINYISLFELDQSFVRIEGKYWFKNYESFQTNMNVFKNSDKQSFMAKKESWRRNIIINHPAIDTLVAGEPRIVLKQAREQKEDFWQLVRSEPLTHQEAQVDQTADSVLNTKVVKFMVWLTDAMQSRYLNAEPIDIGQYDQIYSYNAFEGSRIKVGLRTSNKLTERILFGGHLAYGFKDDKFKYGAFTRFHLNRPNELWHMMGGSYRFDYSFIEQRESFDVHDNILNTILRKDPIDNIFLSRQGKAFYERDWRPDLTTKLDFARRTFFSVPGKFNFDIDNTGNPNTSFTTTELGFKLTYARGLKYFESGPNFDRTPVTSVQPKLILNYVVGINNFLGSDVGYHKLEVSLSQRLLSPIGYTKYSILAGKIYGNVPYPLLELHRGNESIYFEKLSFNLMNDFEFVSDTYASLWLEHHFDGFIFNKIPGIKYLQLRSILYTKMLLGKLDKGNENVVPFLDGLKPLNGFYMEVGFGFENILKLLRVDAIWRLTQREQPNIQKWGIRFVISPKF